MANWDKKIIWLAVFLCSAVVGCEKKRSLLKLNLQAKTHQGDFISQASVLVDGKSIGETDSKGVFSSEISSEIGSRPKVEVRKESDTYYFAPFIDSIPVGEEEVQVANIKATLYFVPKPKPTSAEAEKDLTETPSSPSQVTSSQDDEANTPFTQDAKATRISADESNQVIGIGNAVDSGSISSESEVANTQGKNGSPSETSISDHLPVVTKTSHSSLEDSSSTEFKSHQVDDLAAKAVEKATQESEEVLKINEKSDMSSPSNRAGPSATTVLEVATEGGTQSDDDSIKNNENGNKLSGLEESGDSETKNDLTNDKKPNPLNDSNGSINKSIDDQIKGPAILTVHVASLLGKEEVGLAGVEMHYADSKEKAYKKGCITNERGRCVIRFPSALEAPISVMATKKGYKTVTAQVVIKGQSQHKLVMDRGLTLDIHALTKVYNHVEGLPQVEVLIENKKVGTTDRLGHFSYVFTGKREALVGVTLKAQGYLPEVYETDFVASGPMSLVKYFASPVPPPALVALVPPMPAGNIDQTSISQISGPIQEAIKVSARKHFFSVAAFKEVPSSLLERAAKLAHKDILELKRKGWLNTPLKSQIDALMVPTIIMGAKPAIEISMIDNLGQVMVAAREEIEGSLDAPSIDRAFYVLASRIIKSFPFEGAVIGKDSDIVSINIGHAQGRGVKAGDLVDVYGVQVERLGDKERHKKIGTLTLREVLDSQSKGSLSSMAPRALIERGDLVVLRPRRATDISAAQIHVFSRESGKITEVPQANVYLNGHWLGTTDEAGRLYSDGTGGGTLRVVKHGFREQALEARLTPKGRVDVVLAREAAFIKIESRPSGATVSVEGKSLGRTPLISPIPVPSGFIRIKIESGSGFKPYTTVLELDEGTLDLTGSRAIQLETDFLAQASRMKKAGKIQDAAQILGNVPPTHSDYLTARFDAGELWLSVLDNPAKAESYFAEVLADESVKSFADKRFIGAHINSGIAQFKIAESLSTQDPASSRQYYQKVIVELDSVVPHIRHVPSEQYNQAVHTVDYYRALARHRLWTVSQDPQILMDTVKTWRTYLDGDAKSLPPEGGAKAFLQNAEVYFKQALASLEVARKTVQQ